MQKTSLTRALFIAGAIAAAGVAHAADTFDSPSRAGEASTMTNGVPNAETTNSPYSDGTVVVDTRVLGAGPAVIVPQGTTTYYGPAVTTYYYSGPAPVMEHPSVDWQGHRGYSAPGSYYGD
ncbi:hypothetical protein [Ramlibacter sp.]|uniref:hypothetical protein n=1 Tax=Ramlibacter sp. TaxID=1917967 RepID=UPI002FC8DC67